MTQKINKLIAYSWVAYMITHEPKEMAKVRKYGTPSDYLISLAETPVKISGKWIFFPVSLHKSAGQKLLFEVLKRVDLHIRAIPIKAYELFQHVKTTVRHRRSDTERNLHIVAEAILHRAATEFKTEVLFAFDSINEWIKAVYGKELGYLTIRKALEILVEQGFIKVNEWGKRGNRSKCTKIEFLPLRNTILTYTSNLDDWLLFNDHAMMAVYRRESTTRQDVLESRFQHYADQVAAEIMEESRWAPGVRLFPATDGNMVVVTPTGVAGNEKDMLNETYIDRLLGGLVPTLQENGSGIGPPFAGISGQSRAG